MHIVHKNLKYSTPEEAIQNPDGLAVLGFFFKVSCFLYSSYYSPLPL